MTGWASSAPGTMIPAPSMIETVSSSTTGRPKSYAENQATRVSTLHLVGDQNFGTSLRSVLASRLTGYNLVTGTSLGSHDVTLTIDAALNETAYAALNGRKGVVAVYDYTTGDLLCEGELPSYDPNNPPSDINENPAYEGGVFESVLFPAPIPRLGLLSW